MADTHTGLRCGRRSSARFPFDAGVMMRRHRVVPMVLAFATAPLSTGAAQHWRTLDASRQLRDSGVHHVLVRYGAGRLQLMPSTEPVLYSMSLRYDEDNGRPIYDYDANRRRLTVGLTDQSFNFLRHG